MNILFNNKKGITLIAIIITIIVMLILVIVSINLAVNGSLFSYAGKSSKDTKIAMEDEHELTNVSSEGGYQDLIDKYTISSRREIRSEGGNLYYYVDGELAPGAGLILLDGYYYYVKSNGQIVVGADFYVSNTNDLKPKGVYTFGDDGKMIIQEKKNGIYAEEDSLFYYVDGVRTQAGLILLDGYYYYVKSGGELVWGMTYFVSNTNDLMPRGNYTFDNEGKMIQ